MHREHRSKKGRSPKGKYEREVHRDVKRLKEALLIEELKRDKNEAVSNESAASFNRHP